MVFFPEYPRMHQVMMQQKPDITEHLNVSWQQ